VYENRTLEPTEIVLGGKTRVNDGGGEFNQDTLEAHM
jgi:hypothetical protein